MTDQEIKILQEKAERLELLGYAWRRYCQGDFAHMAGYLFGLDLKYVFDSRMTIEELEKAMEISLTYCRSLEKMHSEPCDSCAKNPKRCLQCVTDRIENERKKEK